MTTKSSNITVLTSITGKKDKLQEKQAWGEATWIAYTEGKSKRWEIETPPDIFKDDRRNSRLPKILSHLYCETEYSIWIDGNITLTKPPEELIERYLKNHDLAVFAHPKRNCIYGEAIRVAKAELDDSERIIEQVQRYEDGGYAKEKGLCECGVLIRRHTKKVIEFNNYWWSEHCRGSVRDQISFMYAVDSVGLRINKIDEHWYLDPSGLFAHRSDFVRIVPHIILNPNIQWRKN